jgi:hypothetical protein
MQDVTTDDPKLINNILYDIVEITVKKRILTWKGSQAQKSCKALSFKPFTGNTTKK